jgi:hypothetical protein
MARLGACVTQLPLAAAEHAAGPDDAEALGFGGLGGLGDGVAAVLTALRAATRGADARWLVFGVAVLVGLYVHPAMCLVVLLAAAAAYAAWTVTDSIADGLSAEHAAAEAEASSGVLGSWHWLNIIAPSRASLKVRAMERSQTVETVRAFRPLVACAAGVAVLQLCAAYVPMSDASRANVASVGEAVTMAGKAVTGVHTGLITAQVAASRATGSLLVGIFGTLGTAAAAGLTGGTSVALQVGAAALAAGAAGVYGTTASTASTAFGDRRRRFV